MSKFIFTIADYFNRMQNTETLNNWVDLYIQQNKSGASILEAIKAYYEELQETHFGMVIPFFDTFLNFIIENNKLHVDFANKLKQELGNKKTG